MTKNQNNVVRLGDGVECVVSGHVFMPINSAITHVGKHPEVADSPIEYLEKGEGVVVSGLAGMDEAQNIQGVVRCRTGKLIAVVSGTPSQEPPVKGRFLLHTVYRKGK